MIKRKFVIFQDQRQKDKLNKNRHTVHYFSSLTETLLFKIFQVSDNSITYQLNTAGSIFNF